MSDFICLANTTHMVMSYVHSWPQQYHMDYIPLKFNLLLFSKMRSVEIYDLIP